MAAGQEFTEQLEKRFAQFPAEKQAEKVAEYKERLAALLAEGKTEEEAVAELERRLDLLPSPVPPENEDYGRIGHPKKPLWTGMLYAICLVAVLLCAALFTRLFKA